MSNPAYIFGFKLRGGAGDEGVVYVEVVKVLYLFHQMSVIVCWRTVYETQVAHTETRTIVQCDMLPG